MKAWALAALVFAGCGPVRMDAIRREGGEQRLYSRTDPDVREAALESVSGEGCREDRWGKWAVAFCVEPEKVRVGVPALLRFEAGGNDGPLAGAQVAVGLTHKGGRGARLAHPDPVVSGVKETAPGRYEATAVFPAEGRWAVEAALLPKEGDTVRLKFELTVAPAPPKASR